jgi:hypothetical protein
MEEVEEILDPSFEIPPDLEPDLIDMLPRGYLSPSQVAMFLKCPHSWELAYVHGKPKKTVARMFQGIFVHNAVETVLRERLVQGKLPPMDAAFAAFSDSFDKSKNLIEDWEDESEGAVKDTGIKCTKAYYTEAAVDAHPIAVEKTFSVVIKSSDGKVRLPILGRIDSIQVQAHSEQEYMDIREKVAAAGDEASVTKPKRVHDLKVTTDKWSQSDLDNDLQFAIYSGVEHVPDVQVDQIVKGRAKEPRPRYEKLTTVMSSRQVDHAVKVVEGVAKSIGLGHFPMTDPGNWWCSGKWCSMWAHCRGKQ